jgi:hypothetical protein
MGGVTAGGLVVAVPTKTDLLPSAAVHSGVLGLHSSSSMVPYSFFSFIPRRNTYIFWFGRTFIVLQNSIVFFSSLALIFV